MKAWKFNDHPETPALIQAEVDRPQPGPGELLIRVHAAGVTPTELQWSPTTHLLSGEVRRGAIPGHEFSGTVVATVAGSGFDVGNEVFGMNDWFAEGATAEYCVAIPSSVVLKPTRLTHAEAASIPIGALTAWQGLFDRANLQAGERVLIHGGAGGVGILAIQLARQRGADIFTTASARQREFLMHLGAQHVIDYRTERFEDVVQRVDVVFDAVGGTTLDRSSSVLGPAGRLVTIAASSEGTRDERAKRAFFVVEPNHEQLSEIARQLDAGTLRPVVERVVPFDEAGTAYVDPSPRERGCGKTVVAVVS